MAKREPLRGKELQEGIIDTARRFGWTVAHFPPVRGIDGYWRVPVAADGKGFLDLLFLRERVLVAEIKGDGDRLRPEQEKWLTAWRLAGIEAYVWTPEGWLSGEVEEVLRTRRAVGALVEESADAAA